ncbi:hypothetical protein EVAR_2422_1 [Eumeta japonica]|uniref:Uncharacterized protein n=1 Tax=Eumeta variegata TaxID=151549 RepID=A0A4C1SNW5_EUMVA|nr:hypothetical protein EVAR_2422_1 [Eumeta japonica]
MVSQSGLNSRSGLRGSGKIRSDVEETFNWIDEKDDGIHSYSSGRSRDKKATDEFEFCGRVLFLTLVTLYALRALSKPDRGRRARDLSARTIRPPNERPLARRRAP